MIEVLEKPMRENEIATTSLIGDICAARDAALGKANQAAEKLREAYELMDEATKYSAGAHNGASFYLDDRRGDDHYKRLFRGDFSSTASLEMYRKQLDACVWTHLMDRIGVGEIMDKTAKDDLRKSLLAEVPEITHENVLATVRQLFGDADLIFKRGLATAFSKLDRRFKSHDGFKIGSRIILTYVFNDWGGWNYNRHHRDTLTDVERVFAVLDGNKPDPKGLIETIDKSRESRGLNPLQSECEGDYFRIKGFKNGNAHLWFTRKDLVEKANKILAEFYGEVIPDGMSKDAAEADLLNRPGLPAKKLQFYPTPQEVVAAMLRDVYLKEGTRVLEPSAGEGNIAHAAADAGAIVTAVEIDRDRYNEIVRRRHERVMPICSNFLQMPPEPEFDFVLMNPPFYGTHWMDHVMHAYEFLKPGGKLVAVLPVSAEIGDSKKHAAFRKWAERGRSNYYRVQFYDLPPESFASSGTRINTVTLTLSK